MPEVRRESAGRGSGSFAATFLCGSRGHELFVFFLCGFTGGLRGRGHGFRELVRHRLWRWRGNRLDLYAGNPAAILFHHGEAETVGFKAFAAAGDESEPAQHEAAHGFVRGVIGERDIVLRLEVADFYARVEDNSAVRKCERALDHVEFVVNFADHLLEDVFQSDEAENAAEFVDNHGEARAARAELDETFAGGLGLGDDQDVADNASNVKVLAGRGIAGVDAIDEDPDNVFDVHETEDVIERTVVDRQARALGRGEHAHRVFERG